MSKSLFIYILTDAFAHTINCYYSQPSCDIMSKSLAYNIADTCTYSIYPSMWVEQL